MPFQFNPVASTEPYHWPGYPEFRAHLNQASYHHADDTGGEWGSGSDQVDLAAKIAVKYRWRFWQIQSAWAAVAPLASFSSLMDKVIKYSRECPSEE